MNQNIHTAVMAAVPDIEYPLEWLDTLINISLNPERLNTGSVLADDVQAIADRLEEEDQKLQLLIKKQVFSLANVNDIENLVRNYHHSLVLLQNQTLSYQQNVKATEALAFKLYKVIIEYIDKLLDFVETYFSSYLTSDELVSSTALNGIKEELKDRFKIIKKDIKSADQPTSITRLVFGRIQNFINSAEQSSDISFRAVQYRTELIHRLESIPWERSPEEGFSMIDQVLIFMNFNSKTYVQKLTKYIHKQVEQWMGKEVQLEKLLFYYKAFKQIQRNNQLIYNPENPNLDEVIENWFAQEISYRKRAALITEADAPMVEDKVEESNLGDQMKLLCNLSGDQIALILRAADDARIVASSSMAEVFKSIVPFLSTKRKNNLSYNSLRSKSYNGEDKDKDVAIEALKRMITKIEDY